MKWCNSNIVEMFPLRFIRLKLGDMTLNYLKLEDVNQLIFCGNYKCTYCYNFLERLSTISSPGELLIWKHQHLLVDLCAVAKLCHIMCSKVFTLVASQITKLK